MLPLFTGIPAHFPHPEKNEIVLWFFHTLHRKKGLNNDFTPNTISPAYHRKASEFPHASTPVLVTILLQIFPRFIG